MNPRRDRSGDDLAEAEQKVSIPDQLLIAGIEAVQAEHALVRPDAPRGVAGAFAPGIAKPAKVAFGGFLSDPPQSIFSQDPVKGAQRADKPAIKTEVSPGSETERQRRPKR